LVVVAAAAFLRLFHQQPKIIRLISIESPTNVGTMMEARKELSDV